MLQATVEALDDLPEVLHEHYEQDGDIYRLRVEGYDDTGLKAVNEDLKKDIGKLKKRLQKAESASEELAELREFRDEHEGKIAEVGNLDEFKAKLEARAQKRIDEAEAARQADHQRMTALTHRTEVLNAMRDAGVIIDRLDEKVMGRTRVDVDPDGEVAVVATGLDGEDTDVVTLLSQMKEDKDKRFAWGFSANGGAGGGAAGSGGGTATIGQVRTKADFANDSLAKSRFIAEHGAKAFEDLPRE